MVANKPLSETQIMNQLKISSWRELSKEKFYEFLELSPQIDKELHIKIIEQVPNYLEFTKNILDSLIEISNQDKELKGKFSAVLDNISKMLAKIHMHDLSTDQKDKILDIQREIVQVINSMDERSSNLKEKIVDILGGIAKIAVVIVGLIWGIRTGRRPPVT